MAQVFAGFVCGFGLALLLTPLLAVMLLRLRTSSALLERLVPPGSSAVGLGLILHGALLLVWTMAGIILGLVLLAMEDAGAGLGSANAPYSLFVLAMALAVAAPVIVLLPSVRQAGAAGFVLVVLVFGWLMPYMAGWSRFDAATKQTEPRYEVFHVGAIGNAQEGS